MHSRRRVSLHHLFIIVIAIGVFEGTSYAQFTVTVTGSTASGNAISNGDSISAPGDPNDPLIVQAAVAPDANITKVVFYRNDVPYVTVTKSPYEITQAQLGQEIYTYRARAYDSTGAWVDSNDFKLTYYTPRFIRMGDPNAPVRTHLPGRFQDHTEDITNAVNWLFERGGGTLFFPCTIPPNSPAIYNIRSTIYIPPNVTLQGESSELGGPCRIYWNDVDAFPPFLGGCHQTPEHLRRIPMFKIAGGTSRVRFRDLWLLSRTTGNWCGHRTDWGQIATDQTAAVELNTDDEKGVGDITDIIFENVTISHFTNGIKAVSDNEGQQEENEISGVKIRAFKPDGNTVGLYINAKYAYNWDIQNFNTASVNAGQGAVEIIEAGHPSVTDGENTKIKFLQLNCNGDRSDPPAFCVRVHKHGGLYFRQLHHEGVERAITVENISPRTNPDPIIFESSVASGEFHDRSMQLYFIGNAMAAAPETVQAGLDDTRLRFKGEGRFSQVVDCGDIHWDWTDVVDNDRPDPEDYKMLFTHSERYRGGFYAEADTVPPTEPGFYIKPHTYCPSDIAEIGAEFFDNGVLPNEDEPDLYSNKLTYLNCPPGNCDVAERLDDLLDNGGSVYIQGSFTVTRTVTVPRGSQIIGAPNAELILDLPDEPDTEDTPDTALFRLHVRILTDTNQTRLSGISIRNLKLTTTETESITRGIAMIGEFDTNLPPPPRTGRPGVSSDIHFSGLTLEGFTTGIYAAPAAGARQGHPMIDGVSLKNISFINNATAFLNTSSNSSNWNVMDLDIQSNVTDAVGWSQVYGGHQGLQDVSCTGTAELGTMEDCIRVQMVGGFYLNGLRQTTNVINALTVGESELITDVPPYEARHFSTMVLRNSDFTSFSDQMGRVSVLGKSFITSMNNTYRTIKIGSSAEANLSRLTWCRDRYPPGVTAYTGLAPVHPNLWVGMPTPTRVECGPRPVLWDEVVRWTNDWNDNIVGQPLVGNFFHDTQEDFVVYRPHQTEFHIQQPGGPGRLTIPVTSGGVPLIGRFFPNARAQLVIFANGQWTVTDPNNSANNRVWNWGSPGDRPFVGNFIQENSVENKDEIAIYRPSDKTFWITNPEFGGSSVFTTTAPNDTEIQVADFLGAGYDQIAQYKDGVWNIVDPRTGFSYTVNFGQVCEAQEPCDIPVAGRYLGQLPGKNPCAQVAVWRPSTEQFLIADPVFVSTYPPNLPTNCGARTASMVWGLNNGQYEDDIPLTINAADFPLLRRPAAYRRTKGAFDHSLSDGQWWVHDRF